MDGTTEQKNDRARNDRQNDRKTIDRTTDRENNGYMDGQNKQNNRTEE